VLAVLAAWAIILVQFDMVNGASLLGGGRALIPRLKVAPILRMIRATLPMGIVVMLMSLTTNIPRYFLEHGPGTQALGIFVGIAYISAPATLVVGSLGKAVMARLSILYANGELSAFRELVRVLILCGAGAGAVGVVVSVLAAGPLLRLLYTAEYAAHGTALVIVMLAAGIGYIASSLGYAVTAAREFVAQIPIYVLVAASVAVCSAVLVPPFGVIGATWALVAGAVVQLATYGWVYARLSSRCARSAMSE
jgi:O-antigen/teichoic acid export membrane protein